MSNIPPWIEVPPARVDEWREAHPEGRIIDVREAEELVNNTFPGAEHLPLSDVRLWLEDFEAPEGVLVLCAKGFRSQRVCEYLHARGHTDIANLSGGITAWKFR